MSVETRDTFLHSQLQEGLKYDIMRAPAVSGAQGYKELCLAAKNEEKRQAELRKRQKYLKPTTQATSQHSLSKRSTFHKLPEAQASSIPSVGTELRRCYQCNKTGHLARECRAPRTESRGQTGEKRGQTGERREKRMVCECQASEGSPLRCTAGTSTNPED